MVHKFIRIANIALLFMATKMTSANFRKFEIDYNTNQLLKDGRPYQYISCSVHYYKVPQGYWLDRIERVRAMGCSAVQTYIWWGVHEPFKGHFDFSGQQNLTEFIRIANSLNLLVILRIGPYIDDTVDMGGLPYWLLKYPDMYLRTSDSRYLAAIDRFYAKLLPMIKPLLYNNGGPVIMVQLENEYGSYHVNGGACDRKYTAWLRDTARKYLGKNVIYFTTDGGTLYYMKCGYIPGVYPTVDFGPTSKAGVENAFLKVQRKFAPEGPLINSEFYAGNFDMWGDNITNIPVLPLTDTMEYMWAMNASFNIFMGYGGTQFGYQAAGEYNNPYGVMTTFFWNAPITEGGNITNLFLGIRKTTEKLRNKPVPYPLPSPLHGRAYPSVPLKKIGSVSEILPQISNKSHIVRSKYPKSFEQLDQPYGFVMYQTNLKTQGKFRLEFSTINDRAYVMINGNLKGVLQRYTNNSLNVSVKFGDKLEVLVENQGRICYGKYLNDTKGLIHNVTLNGEVLTNWDHYLLKFPEKFQKSYRSKTPEIPAVWAGSLQISRQETIEDTFLEMRPWGKGVAWVNGINLGRYWPILGPQQTMWLPKFWLKHGLNRIVIIELERPACDGNSCKLDFSDRGVVN